MKTSQIKLLVLGILMFTGIANAQLKQLKNKEFVKDNYNEGFRLGFGASVGYMFDPGIPGISDDDLFAGLALGLDVRLQYDLTKRTSLTLTTGYDHFFVSNDAKKATAFGAYPEINDIGLIPVKAGFKAFFWEDQFYALGEAGVGSVVSKNNPFEDTTFLFAPGIGYATKIVDLSLRYQYYSEFETGQIALRFAYGFKL